MTRQLAVLWRIPLLLLGLAACTSTPLPVEVTVRPSPTRVDATRWPTRTPTATHTPLPTLTPTATRTPTPTPIPGLLLSGLSDLAYPVETVPDGAVRLRGGVSDAVDGRRFSLADAVAFGDLDADGRDDAVVLLVERAGDGPATYHLAVVTGVDGRAEPVASLQLGSGILVRSMVVATQRLTLDLFAFDQGDAPCCPTQVSQRVYALEGTVIELVSQRDGPRQQSLVPVIPPRQGVPFAPGTTASVVRGRLSPLGEQRFTIPGETGRLLELGVGSPGEVVRLALRGLSDGAVHVSVGDGSIRWSGSLPASQDYELSLVSLSGGATTYALAVSLAALPLDSQAPVTATAAPIATQSPTTTAPPGTSSVTTEVPDAAELVTATVPITGAATVTPTVATGVPAGSTLALTFDGGGLTEEWIRPVVDALTALEVPGTFFLAGDASVGDLLAVGASGMWTGEAESLDRVGRAALIADLADASGSLGAGAARCVRPSVGAMDAYTRVLLAERGFDVLLWDLEADRTGGADGAASLVRLARPGSVIRIPALGDPAEAVSLLREAVPDLIDLGYEFVAACNP